MDDLSKSNHGHLIKIQVFKSDFNKNNALSAMRVNNPLFDSLSVENCEMFFHYIDWLGLAHHPNLMVLSSHHHYYYDYEDLKDVKAIINLKLLNEIRNLNSFLHTLFRILPPGAGFLGCFKENKRQSQGGSPFNKSLGLINGILNFLDSKTARELSRDEVKKLLESHGFRVSDMTVLNMTTYFKAINTRGSAI